MAKPYCCFFDPEKSYEPRELTDTCPFCGRKYGFPLTDPPRVIGAYRVIRPLERGFYGATYLVERGRLGQRYVLKVIPHEVYGVFNKNFDVECRLHQEVAAGTDHVVRITDADDLEVTFGDTTIRCHVAELDYIEGPSLAEFAKTADARALAQIAVDLFRLMQEFENKQRFHNDLHSGNIIIQQLAPDQRRGDAIDDGIRAVAVDLGSLADESKSGDRLSDWHSIARHLFSFVDRLLERPSEASDLDYRLAALLQEIGSMLSPDVLGQRQPDFAHLGVLVRDAFFSASSPWREPGPLRSLKDGYNAQTLHWWYVPRILVDPEGDWLPRVSTPGPQVITGMRGCGKTMLLRALQFHARVSAAQMRGGGSEHVLERLQDERFVGIYVPCTRLLDTLGRSSATLHEPYARLFVAYAREAVRAARHLRDVDRGAVSPGYHRRLRDAVAQYLRNGEDLEGIENEIELERKLQEVLVSLDRGHDHYGLEANPTIAFTQLAEAIRTCSPTWETAIVLYLLDDVSTRHLNKEAISELISTLLFSHEICAFKLTTELQTLEDLARSPGLIEKARLGRDYDRFDLGGEVNKRLAKAGGKKFIADILRQRAAHYSLHPRADPAQMLGDVPLEQIAREIHAMSETERRKKEIYRGVSALTAVCVGDIGDVISLYEMMVREARGAPAIDPKIQSSCYQYHCSRRLFQLQRRGGLLKDFALSFAAASHRLLKQSDKSRLRQYAKIYVRLTTGDTAAQFEQIRELIDAGVFVLEGGSDAPRTKTRDSDPLQQFVLTYRKLFGLSSYIGLADRDRFELTGRDLEEWLARPEEEILVRNLRRRSRDVDEADEVDEPSEETAADDGGAKPTALTLFEEDRVGGAARLADLGVASAEEGKFAAARVPRAVQLRGLPDMEIDAVVLGLGFEERTLRSAERVLERTSARRAVLVRYNERGHSDQINQLVRAQVDDVEVVDYGDVLAHGFAPPRGGVLVDVTGLAKPVLFDAVRRALVADRYVFVAHTLAERHYPLSEEIEPVLEAERERDAYGLLEALDKIWSGEEPSYSFDRLLHTEADETRRRLLMASASPKHQRLLSLVDERDFDRVAILAPTGETARSRLARLAAEVAVGGVTESTIEEVGSNDLEQALRIIARDYQRWYVNGGYDFELGLTGSKLHAVAFAAAAAALKISQCWYVRPAVLDPEHFTHGVGETHYFALEMAAGVGDHLEDDAAGSADEPATPVGG